MLLVQGLFSILLLTTMDTAKAPVEVRIEQRQVTIRPGDSEVRMLDLLVVETLTNLSDRTITVSEDGYVLELDVALSEPDLRAGKILQNILPDDLGLGKQAPNKRLSAHATLRRRLHLLIGITPCVREHPYPGTVLPGNYVVQLQSTWKIRAPDMKHMLDAPPSNILAFSAPDLHDAACISAPTQ